MKERIKKMLTGLAALILAGLIWLPSLHIFFAIVISAGFLLVHLAGWREYTSVLNGPAGPESVGWGWSAFFGVTYIIVYLAFVILAPVLIMGAGILAGWRWHAAKERPLAGHLETQAEQKLFGRRDLVRYSRSVWLGAGWEV